MKKLAKTDADWIIATAVKNAVRRDWNRIVRACLPKVEADGAEGEGDTADAAPGAGTKASDKATTPVATTPEAVLGMIQNCAASMPDASSLAVFIQSVATLAKRLESDRKAGRAILHCEA
jgi:Tfp pilus assembly protein PilW